ncbi:deoxynucleoside kinase-like [Dysidea avara]|uniref:deoxynucleoside kinase-like n=1 Tax=Dysidea avara TaxID=196820 RepID=UPI003325D12E
MLGSVSRQVEEDDNTRLSILRGPQLAQVPRRKATTTPSIRIAVEGNIASGKSTLLRMFAKQYSAKELAEPVKKWQNLGGENVLDRMYQDPKRWSYLFQSYVLLTMMEVHNAQVDSRLSVMERSVYSARHCFVENLHVNNLMDDMEYSCYLQWFDYLITNNKPQLDLIVYLRTSPEVCMQRLKLRGRQEEEPVTMEYLQSLHDRHEEWLSGNKWASLNGIPVLVLNGDTDFQKDTTFHQKQSYKIVQKLSQLGIFSSS